jgi:hypothetical protein
MNKIEIVGRLKKRVRIGRKDYYCNDVNLDKDFLIDFTNSLLIALGQCDTRIQYEKFFDEEIISKVKVNILIDEKKFDFTLSRDTFGNKVLVGCEINVESNEGNIFGSVYDVKIQMIGIFNRFCENSNIFFLQDFNNEQICQAAYIEIYKVENRLRSILTRYLMKKYGELILSKSLKKEVDEYSKWFRQEEKEKYKTFKRVNTDYANIDFLNLPEILELKDSNIVDEVGETVTSKLSRLKELVDNDACVNDLSTQIKLIEEAINNREHVFGDKPSKKDEEEAIEFFGTKDVLNYRDLLVILDDEFKDRWRKLSKMRNTVAHNKPICKELYQDILNLCQWMHNKFGECGAYIESSFYSDEEGVRSALEDMEIEKEKYESDYVEQQREACGIEFPLSESYVETVLAENCIGIQNLINVVNGLEDIGWLVEEINNCIYEIKEINNNGDYLRLQTGIKKIIIEELDLKIDSDDNNQDLNKFFEKHIFQGFDMQEALQYYTENKDYLDSNFDYFDLDFKVSWYGIDNKNYSITVDGDLSPENGGIDDLQFSLYVNDEPYKTYYVQINYGDYCDPSDGYIDDSQIEILAEEIKSNIEDTIKFLTKIHKVSEKIMELF